MDRIASNSWMIKRPLYLRSARAAHHAPNFFHARSMTLTEAMTLTEVVDKKLRQIPHFVGL